jgi:hypothetical protein
MREMNVFQRQKLRWCDRCRRNGAFLDGECVACRARGFARAAGIQPIEKHQASEAEHDASAAFHEFCRIVERY